MPAEEVTRLLLEWKNGNQAAVDALTPIVYSELRRLAANYMRDEVALEDALGFAPERSSSMIALDDALTELAKMDPRQAKVIELRFFGGFSVEEVAQSLNISVATVGREQRMAEAWLHREMQSGPAAAESGA